VVGPQRTFTASCDGLPAVWLYSAAFVTRIHLAPPLTHTSQPKKELQVVEGDLLTYDADCESSPEAQLERVLGDGLFTKCLSTTVIAHQCNCMSKGARGLAKALFAAFPEVRETLGCIRLRWINILPVYLRCATGRVLMLITPTAPGLPSAGQHLQASDRRRRQATV
jgi:hypothetical protein